MEKIKSNLSQTVQTLSQTPLKNMVYDKTMEFGDNLNTSRMQYIKRFAFWFIIIIILAVYGFNIFTYLAEGTDLLTALISPFLYVFSLLTRITLKSIIENTSQGGQTLITGISNFFGALIQFFSQFLTGSLKVAETSSVSAIDQLQSNLTKDKINSGNIKNTTQTNTNISEENTEETMLKSERKLADRTRDVPSDIKKTIENNTKTEPIPLQSGSNEHGSNEQGYCYIGKQNNIRNCAKVSARNKCMSGDIFPTLDLCINPNLRS